MSESTLTSLWAGRPHTLIVFAEPLQTERGRFEVSASCPGQDIYLQLHQCPHMTGEEIKAFFFSTFNLVPHGRNDEKQRLIEMISVPEPFRMAYSKMEDAYRVKIEAWAGNHPSAVHTAGAKEQQAMPQSTNASTVKAKPEAAEPREITVSSLQTEPNGTEIARLQVELKDKERQINKKNGELAAQEDLLAKLKKEFKALAEKAASQSLKTAPGHQLEPRIIAYGQALTTTPDSGKALKAEIGTLQKERDEYKAEAARYKKELEEYQELAEIWQASEREINEDVENQRIVYEKKYEKLQGEYDGLLAIINQLKNRLESLVDEPNIQIGVDDFKEKLQRAKDSIDKEVPR